MRLAAWPAGRQTRTVRAQRRRCASMTLKPSFSMTLSTTSAQTATAAPVRNDEPDRNAGIGPLDAPHHLNGGVLRIKHAENDLEGRIALLAVARKAVVGVRIGAAHRFEDRDGRQCGRIRGAAPLAGE